MHILANGGNTLRMQIKLEKCQVEKKRQQMNVRTERKEREREKRRGHATKENCSDNTCMRVLLARGITRRGEGGSHSAGSHFHGVAVTEIKMVAGALLPPYGGLTANVSAPYMAAACTHHGSVRARTYVPYRIYI